MTVTMPTFRPEVRGLEAKEPLSFLVVRRDNIGDLVCTTPLLHALRTRFPKAHIYALVNSYNAPALQNNPDIDGIFAYTKAKHRPRDVTLFSLYWQRMQMFLRMRRMCFDYAILSSPRFSPRSLRLARLAGAQHIIGFNDPNETEKRGLDIAVPYTLEKPLHEVEDIFRLLEPLGIRGEPPQVRVFPGKENLERAQRTLRSLARPNDKPIIGIHISARKISQRWPSENFTRLIQCLWEEHHVSFLLFWSPGSNTNPLHPGDDEKAKEIVEKLSGIPILAYASEQLPQLIAGLSLCDVIVCSDGGAMHLAAGLNKPIVCFFGKSDQARWHPWGVPYILCQPPSLDVKDISVETALEGVRKLLALTQQAR